MQCEECGKEFRRKAAQQRFCSPKCHDDYWNREKGRVAEEAERDAYADEVAAHEARMNGHSPPSKKLDVVAMGLVKPKPPLGLLPLKSKNDEAA